MVRVLVWGTRGRRFESCLPDGRASEGICEIKRRPVFVRSVAGFWIGSLWAIIADNKLARVDAASGRVTAATITTPYPAQEVISGLGPDVFIVESIGGGSAAVARVNPASNCVDGLSAPFSADAESATLITNGPSGVHVAYSVGKLAPIDPATMQTRATTTLDQPGLLSLPVLWLRVSLVPYVRKQYPPTRQASGP